MNDLRFALRQLARNPGFTSVAVLVLALGIGANSAMFSLVNALLFRPLTAHHPASLVGVYSRSTKPDGKYRDFSYPAYLDIREHNAVFTDLAAFRVALTGWQEGDTTRRTFTGVVSANYFATFGIHPRLGRDFTPAEERAGAGSAVVIVSDAWWQRTGADPAIVGRSIRLNGQPFTVIGVAPEGFTGTTVLFCPDFWVPLGAHDLLANDAAERRGRDFMDRTNELLFLLGRLRPGLTLAQATLQLAPLARQLADAHPGEDKDHALEAHDLPRLSITSHPQDNSEIGALALLLLPMSGVVLLVACLNLANMLLARGAARRKEIAVRLALGGSRGRILRQLLTEGMLLSCLGGLGGLAFAWAIPRLLAQSLTGRLSGLTIVLDSRPDPRVFVCTLLFCVLATLIFAFVPALKLARTEVVHDLKDLGADHTDGRIRTGLLAPRNLLVTTQLALSLALLTAACLFLRGARNAADANPGFALDDGLLVELDAGLAGRDEAAQRALYQRALERVRNLPGVASAGFATVVPFGMFYDSRSVRPVGGFGPNAVPDAPRDTRSGGGVLVERSDPTRGLDNGERGVEAGFVIASRDYFHTVALALKRGRDFDALEEQGASAAPVAIIDERLAELLWGDLEPLGRQLETIDRKTGKPKAYQVIGVVAGVRQNLNDEKPGARFYVPLGQEFQSWINLHVRPTQTGPEAAGVLLRTVREDLRHLDEHLPILSSQTLRTFHDQSVVLWGFRTASKLFGAFALLALFLSVVGVYGVRAYLVTRRTREIGIRIALGASREEVARHMLREGLRLALAGLGAGVLVALLAGRLLAGSLYKVAWADPVSLGFSVLVLGLATLVACWLPARRAASIEPMRALRCD